MAVAVAVVVPAHVHAPGTAGTVVVLVAGRTTAGIAAVPAAARVTGAAAMTLAIAVTVTAPALATAVTGAPPPRTRMTSARRLLPLRRHPLTTRSRHRHLGRGLARRRPRPVAAAEAGEAPSVFISKLLCCAVRAMAELAPHRHQLTVH